jgi:hypothetical protein
MKSPKILNVKALERYKLHVLFSDSTEGVYDVSHLAGKGVFKLWEMDDTFEKVYVSKESGAISWPEELDIDTITVYCKIKGIDVEAYLKRANQHASYM